MMMLRRLMPSPSAPLRYCPIRATIFRCRFAFARARFESHYIIYDAVFQPPPPYARALAVVGASMAIFFGCWLLARFTSLFTRAPYAMMLMRVCCFIMIRDEEALQYFFFCLFRCCLLPYYAMRASLLIRMPLDMFHVKYAMPVYA